METGWVLNALWKTSLQAGIMAAAVWIVCRLAKRAPASFRCALWVLVLVKLFVPPFADVPGGWAFWSHAGEVVPVVSESAPVYSPPAVSKCCEFRAGGWECRAGEAGECGGGRGSPSDVDAERGGGCCGSLGPWGLRVRDSAAGEDAATEGFAGWGTGGRKADGAAGRGGLFAGVRAVAQAENIRVGMHADACGVCSAHDSAAASGGGVLRAGGDAGDAAARTGARQAVGYAGIVAV